MSKYYRFVLLLVAVGLIGCTAAYAGVPSVLLYSFDPNTSTYIYQVTQGTDASDSLTDFNVLAYTSPDDPYTVGNPSSGGGPDGQWINSSATWINYGTGQQGVEYQWLDGYVKKGQFLQGVPWVGYFTLSIPGTQPVPGIVTTMGGSQTPVTHYVNVPAFVPEPSGLLALGSMLLGVGPLALRLRRK